jgi:hypothetical protein
MVKFIFNTLGLSSGWPGVAAICGSNIALVLVITACQQQARESMSQEQKTNQTVLGQSEGPILRILMRTGPNDFGVCRLSTSRKSSTSRILGDNGEILREDIARLATMGTNGFDVIFQRYEVLHGKRFTNSIACFFPFNTTTVTQVFGSTQVTGQFTNDFNENRVWGQSERNDN